MENTQIINNISNSHTEPETVDSTNAILIKPETNNSFAGTGNFSNIGNESASNNTQTSHWSALINVGDDVIAFEKPINDKINDYLNNYHPENISNDTLLHFQIGKELISYFTDDITDDQITRISFNTGIDKLTLLNDIAIASKYSREQIDAIATFPSCTYDVFILSLTMDRDIFYYIIRNSQTPTEALVKFERLKSDPNKSRKPRSAKKSKLNDVNSL